MSARDEVLAHLAAPMFKTEPAALALLDAFRAEVLREAAEAVEFFAAAAAIKLRRMAQEPAPPAT